jgi:hypothetical protein
MRYLYKYGMCDIYIDMVIIVIIVQDPNPHALIQSIS